MAETEVVTPPPVPLEEPVGKDAPEKREGKPERPRREPEEIPEMTVEEAIKALNALPKAEVQPDNDEHELKVAAINEDIKKIKDQIEVLRTKIDGANEARRGQGDEMGEARAVMRTLKEERDEIRGQLDAKQAESAKAKAALDGHDKSRRALQSSLKYKTVGEIETAIRQMESRQQTCSMSLAEEKKLIKEMEQLKQSKKTAAQYVSHEEALGKAKDAHGAARKTESETKAELRVIQEKLKVAFTVLEEMSKAREEEGGGVNTLFEEKKALHEEINVKIEEIKELRSAHRARLDQWFNSKRERTKLKKALKSAEYLARQALRTARNKAFEDEEAKKIPYESEMVLCDTLVSYLETTFMKETPKTAATPAPSEAACTEEFGGIKMVMKKRQNEEFIVGGKKKGAGKRKKKHTQSGGKNAPAGRSTIVHAIDTMESFSMLSIAPPPNKAAVPDAIKALKDKKTWFSEQPRQPMTAGKPAQAAEKTKKAPKVKAPDINDEEFPGLPGMAKPKAQEASEDSDGEKANGAGAEGGEGGEEDDAADGEKVVPPTAASIVANGVNGVAKPEADAPAAAAASSSDEPVDAAADAAEVDATEDGAQVAEAAAAATSDDDADSADTKKVESEQKTDSSPEAEAAAAGDCAKSEAAEVADKEADIGGGDGEDKEEEVVEEVKAGAEEE